MGNSHVKEKRRPKSSAGGTDNDHKKKKPLEAQPGTQTSSKKAVLLYGGLAAATVIFVYIFPNFFKTLLDPWIAFGEPNLHGITIRGDAQIVADVPRRDAIVNAFKHAWHAYESDAMGADEYHPISHQGSNLSEAGGIGYTVVDSLDTMMIMGLNDESARARKWIDEKLSFEKDGSFSTFETTIRVLGGLLSAYHLSGRDQLYLEKAVDIADRLLFAFDTPSGLPLSSVNLANRIGISDTDNNGWVSTAEVATLQLEFRYLSLLTENDTYWEKVEKVMERIRQNNLRPHLAPIFMDPNTGGFVPYAIRLGSRGDSYYEYLLKQFLQTAREEVAYKAMYIESMDAINQYLVQKSNPSALTYTAELIPERQGGGNDVKWRLIPKQDHLVCFLGGSLMLGATTIQSVVDEVSVPPRLEQLSEAGRRDWEVGVELIQTCMETHNTATGLSPEIVHFRTRNDRIEADFKGVLRDWYIKDLKPGIKPPLDARYILRPETVESLFIAYRLTGESRYREWGWRIFEAIEKHCKIPTGGYAAVLNVDELPVTHEDKMETFLLSETLKYLYLLFSDADVLPLSDFVFNTEAHPLPVFQPHIRTGFS